MDIHLENLGRRYNRQWIFSNLSLRFQYPGSMAVLGPNGSGKSTLLQIISGYLSPSEGKVEYLQKGIPMPPEGVYKNISYVAPYIEIPSAFSMLEFFDFHFGLKGFHPSLNLEQIMVESGIIDFRKRYIGELSTGIQQRVKILAALGSDTSLILFDEPTANLDEGGKEWFGNILVQLKGQRSFMIGSNIPEEYEICETQVKISDFKSRIRV